MEPMAGQDAVPDGNLGKYVVSVTKFKQMNYLLVKYCHNFYNIDVE